MPRESFEKTNMRAELVCARPTGTPLLISSPSPSPPLPPTACPFSCSSAEHTYFIYFLSFGHRRIFVEKTLLNPRFAVPALAKQISLSSSPHDLQPPPPFPHSSTPCVRSWIRSSQRPFKSKTKFIVSKRNLEYVRRLRINKRTRYVPVGAICCVRTEYVLCARRQLRSGRGETSYKRIKRPLQKRPDN